MRGGTEGPGGATGPRRVHGRGNDIEEGRTRAGDASIRLLVLDDSELKRLGIVTALRADDDIVVAGEAGAWPAALEILRRERVDVAIVEPHVAGAKGTPALQRLAVEAPDLPVVVVSSSDRADELLEAVSAGVRGYLGRATTAAELRAAIRSVHAGGTVIAPELAGHLLRHVRSAEPARDARTSTTLSARERDVLRLVMRGHTQDEIARDLEVSERTVQLVLARLREKTGLRRRSDLLRWAAEQDVR